jgi:hypothetical protein
MMAAMVVAAMVVVAVAVTMIVAVSVVVMLRLSIVMSMLVPMLPGVALGCLVRSVMRRVRVRLSRIRGLLSHGCSLVVTRIYCQPKRFE